MSNCTYLVSRDNRSYLNESVVPFKGHYTDERGIQQHRFMFVYVVHCIPTDQYYVGQHTCEWECKDPMQAHYRGSGRRLQKLRKQYDWYKDFTFQIIEFFETREQLAQGEHHYIAQYQQQYGDKCLNIRTYEQTPKLDLDRHGGKKHPRAKPIVNLTTGEWFKNCSDAAKSVNVGPITVYNACKIGQRSGGTFWAFSKTPIDEPTRLQMIKQLEQQMADRVELTKRQHIERAKQRQGCKIVIEQTGETFESVTELAQTKQWNLNRVLIAAETQISYNGYTFKITKPSQYKTSRKKIVNITTQTVYDDVYQASVETGFEVTRLKNRARNHRPLEDQYWMWLDDFNGDYEQTLQQLQQQYHQTLEHNQQQRKLGNEKALKKVCKKVICIETQQIYDTVNEARVAAGYSANCTRIFGKRLREGTKCANGLHYAYYNEK